MRRNRKVNQQMPHHVVIAEALAGVEPCAERVEIAVPDLWVRFVAMRCSVDEHGQFPAEEYPRFCERFLG